MKQFLSIAFAFFWSYLLVGQATFECNAKLLLSQYNGGAPTRLNEIEVLGNNAIFQQINQHQIVYNSSGYNRLDNLIYGFNAGPREVFRLFADNTFQSLGALPSLPGGLVAGDVDSSGNYLLAGSDGSLHYVDVSGPTAFVQNSIPLTYSSSQFSGNPRFIDIAFHPQTQELWGYDNNTQRMVRIDPATGTVYVVGIQQPGYALGAMFFNALSELYGYDTQSLYRIDLSTGQISFVANGPTGSGRDGCSCPYTLQISKRALETAVCPGDTITYEIKISNLTGASMPGVTFIDNLDPRLTITSISNTLGGVIAPVTGLGTSSLTIQQMTLQRDDNFFQFTAVVDTSIATGAMVKNQALITDLSVVTSDTLYSDDPTTGPFGDSTTVEVYPKFESRLAIASNGNTCPGDTLSLIGLSNIGASYTWYGPDDTAIAYSKNVFIYGLYNTDSGWYTIDILQNGCTRIEDSIFIDLSACNAAFDCTNPFLLSHGNINTNIEEVAYNTLFQLSPVTATSQPVNALGYHPIDNYIYGIQQPGNQLMRLYANGNQTAMPMPIGVPLGSSFVAGDIDSAGAYTIINEQGQLAQLKVDQKTPTLQHLSNLTYRDTTGQPYFGDIAFHPLSNRLYGFDTVTQKLATIDPVNGWVDTFGPVDTQVVIEGLFFNNFGRLYGYGQDTLYRLQADSGAVFALTTGQATGTIDGCVCPDGLAMEKLVLPGFAHCINDTFTYLIRIQNNTGVPQPVFQLQDYIDPQLTITNIVNPLAGTVPAGTGVGTNRFLLFQTTIPKGETQIRLSVTHRPTFTGGAILQNQAFMLTNNAFIGDTIWSDDPGSGYILDNTPVQIGSIDNISLVDSRCGPDTVWFAGQMLTKSGLYQAILPNKWGCDSTVTMDLTIQPSYRDTIPVQICQGGQYYAGGQFQTSSGLYTDSYTTQFGCDSLVITDLQVVPFVTTTLSINICDGDSYLAGGAPQTQAGTYYDTLTSYLGCDSIVITFLRVLQPTQSSTSLSICAGDSVFLGGNWQNTAGNYVDTLPSIAGCDSIVTTQLVLTPPITTIVNRVLCTGDSLFVGGEWQTTNGTYADTLIASNGCDSILITQLSFNVIITASSRLDICFGDSVFAAGDWQTQAGLYVDSAISQLGCDSIHTLELVIHQASSSSQSITLCQGDSLLVGGAWQTKSGIYTDTYSTIWGCDSVVTTTLQFNASFSVSRTDSICQGGSLLFGGQTITTAGTYFDTLTAQTGCDSVLSLRVIVLPLPQPQLGPDTTLCEGDIISLSPGIFPQYQWNDGSTNSSITIDQAGTYSVTVTDNNGCIATDSRAIGYQALPNFTLGTDTTFCPGFSFTYSFSIPAAAYQWQDGSSQSIVTIDQPGQYWLRVTADNCSLTDTININEYLLEPLQLPPDTLICLSETYTLDVSQPNGASYQWAHGPTTPLVTLEEAMTYEVVITDSNGCQQVGFITLEKEYCPPSIRWPSAFSPNSDGQNDLFQLQTELVDILQIQIFNRWGGLVFESIGNQAWDGTFNGQPAQMGTYIIVVQYLDETGQLLQRQANLTLLR